MSHNNKSILAVTLVNIILLLIALSDLFEDMNILRFLIIGFAFISVCCPLLCMDSNKDDN